MVVRRDQSDLAMSAEEQLRSMEDFRRGPGYFEVKCGCTCQKFGDSSGKLRVFANGKFMISCECRIDCKEEKLTPYEFVKHSRRPGTKCWTEHIWVMINGLKVPLGSTILLEYYKKPTNEGNGARKRIFHHDEFIRCSKCKKERRFRLRSQEECHIYHDAAAKEWKCADMPYDKITCEDEEERASRKSNRGCPRLTTCDGCTSCACFGCFFKCRFPDCDCRMCIDFMQHGQP